MAVLTSKLILELIDRITAPARTIAASLNKITAMQQSNAAMMAATSQKLFVTAAAAYALAKGLQAPVQAAAAFETSLLNVGQKADMSDESIAAMGKRIRALAPIINQSALEVAKGVDTLVGFGLDPERAETLMGPIGRAATAYQAQIDDLAKAGFAALDNLKVKAGDFGKALDVMAQSGKEGAFEIKDMAQHFPQLSAAAQALKMTGVPAVGRLSAALQIARKGAGDGATAANNTANLMQKIISPETTKKFKAFGIDIRKELKKTQDAGGDIFEMIAKQVDKALKGDLSKIGDIFGDKQVSEFLNALIPNLEEYRKIRDKALSAKGVVDNDFDRRMKTNAAQTQAFKIQVNDLSITIGNILLPTVNRLMAAISPVIKSFERFAAANPKLVTGIVAVTASLIGLRMAGLAARLALGWMAGAALMTAAAGLKALAIATRIATIAMLPFGAALRAVRTGLVAARTAMIGFAAVTAILGTGGALKMAGVALLGLLNPLRLVRAGLFALKVAMIGTGIGAALVAIGAAGAFIYQNWSGIKAMFAGIGTGLMAALQPVMGTVQPVIDLFSRLYEKVSGMLGPINAGKAAWQSFGESIGSSVGGVITTVIQKVADLADKVGTLASDMGAKITAGASALYAAGGALLTQLWEGMKAKFGALLGWAAGIPGRVAGALGGGNSRAAGGAGNAVGGAPAVAGARAAGGPVQSGRSYLVGERGMELFTPGMSGGITSAADTVRLLKENALAGAAKQSGGGGGGSMTNTVTIQVQAAPGQSTEAIAAAVERKFSEKLAQLSRGAYSDGVN